MWGGVVLSPGGGDQNLFPKAKGGAEFFRVGKGGTRIFPCRQRGGGPEKIGDRPSQTDSPTTPTKIFGTIHFVRCQFSDPLKFDFVIPPPIMGTSNLVIPPIKW